MLRTLRLVALGAVFTLAFAGQSLVGRSAPQVPSTGPVADEFASLHFRHIGPATMSGRITDFAVYEENPAIYYVGTAHGGVWKTTSNGVTFEALLQHEGEMSIGDVTMSQSDPDLVWVGGGESNNRQSISWGNGVWKTTDGGATWTHMGLSESRHINRIVIDPEDDDTVFVGATGPLFGAGGERGLYKTTDGGATWRRVLFVDDDTGINDVAMSPADNQVLYASTYQRRRSQCCMNGGGPGSGIWKSTDGGENWTRLSEGLPTTPLGRIGLSVFRRSQNIVYALVEGERGPGGRGGGGAQAGRGGAGAQAGRGAATPPPLGSGLYRSDDGGENWRRVSTTNPRPMYFSQVRIDPDNPDRVYLGGVGLHMTVDGGQSIATDAARAIHDDIHAIWIDPDNTDHILIGGDGGVAVSYDMSRTWRQLPNLSLALFYHISYDMAVPYNVCGGLQDNYNWCGPSAVRFPRGIRNSDWYQVQGGDGFIVLVDRQNSNIVYSESQNGNIQRKNRLTGESKNIRPNQRNVQPDTQASFRWNWDTPIVFSPHDRGAMLVAANRVFKTNDMGDSWTMISPDLTTNADRDEIETMGLLGDQITIARNDGISSWPTIVSLAESPVDEGVYFTGTDDGVVSMSSDGGETWDNITSRLPGFPEGAWVSEVVPSAHNGDTVYVTVDAHRLNDYETYMWASDDAGQTFRSLNGTLSGQVVRTLLEDPKNGDILYAGTETGIFLTLDRGLSWRRLTGNFPTVRVDEMAIHSRDNALIVGTHGRGAWILDHLEPIQEYAAAQAASGATLFSIPRALEWRSNDNQNDEFWGHEFFVGENPPFDAVIQYHLERAANTEVKLRFSDRSGDVVRELTAPDEKRQPGIQTMCWDMRVEPIPPPPPAAGRGGGGAARGAAARGGGAGRGGRGPGGGITDIPSPMPAAGYRPENPCGGGGGGGRGGFGGGGTAGPWVLPGTYDVTLVVDGADFATKPMLVVSDPAHQISANDRRRLFEMSNELHQLQRRGTEMTRALDPFYTQMNDINGRIGDMENVPDSVKGQFTAVNNELEAVRVKFGVPAPQGGGGGRGRGGRGGGGDPNNVVSRVGSVKSQMMAFVAPPSDALMRQYNDVRRSVPDALDEANSMLVNAMALGRALGEHGVTLDVPAPVR